MDRSLNKEYKSSVRFTQDLGDRLEEAARKESLRRRARVTASDLVREATEKLVESIVPPKKLKKAS